MERGWIPTLLDLRELVVGCLIAAESAIFTIFVVAYLFSYNKFSFASLTLCSTLVIAVTYLGTTIAAIRVVSAGGQALPSVQLALFAELPAGPAPLAPPPAPAPATPPRSSRVPADSLPPGRTTPAAGDQSLTAIRNGLTSSSVAWAATSSARAIGTSRAS